MNDREIYELIKKDVQSAAAPNLSDLYRRIESITDEGNFDLPQPNKLLTRRNLLTLGAVATIVLVFFAAVAILPSGILNNDESYDLSIENSASIGAPLEEAENNTASDSLNQSDEEYFTNGDVPDSDGSDYVELPDDGLNGTQEIIAPVNGSSDSDENRNVGNTGIALAIAGALFTIILTVALLKAKIAYNKPQQ